MVYFILIFGLIVGINWKWLLLFAIAEIIDKHIESKKVKLL